MYLRACLNIALPIVLLTSVFPAIFFILTNVLSQSFFLVVIVMVVILCLLIPVLYLTIELPLLRIQHAIKCRSLIHLNKLLSSRSRFGRLALLVFQSFEQKKNSDSELSGCIKLENNSINTVLQYQHLFENARDAGIITDEHGTITHCNKQAHTLFTATDRESLTGKQMIDQITDTLSFDRCSDIFTKPSSRIDLCDFECEMIKLNGDRFFAEVRFTPYIQDGNVFSAFFHIHDITSKKEAESNKKRIENNLQTITKMEAIEQLAGGIAHEYNNIFGAISGYADLMKRHYPEDDRLQKYASMLMSASGRAVGLTKKLLTFARCNKLRMTQFDAVNELMEITDMLKNTLPDSITLTFHNSAAQTILYGDMQQFRNAIISIVMNAYDAISAGGEVAIASTIFTTDNPEKTRYSAVENPGRYFTITVSDTGCGMTANTISHLFEPFFTTKEQGKGTGLGLASVYGTIKSHHGYIDVKSVLKEGSVFTLFFPLAALPLPVKSPRCTPLQQSILVADNETSIRDILTDILSLLGYVVTVCSDGDSALAFFTRDPSAFDCILLDIYMPGMTGLECFRSMKRIRRDVRVIIATGYCLDDERRAMLDEGVCSVIQKPFLSEELHSVIASAINDTPLRHVE